MNLKTLPSQWNKLLQAFDVEPRVSQKIFLDLVNAYSSPHRFYHSLEHIQQVLDTIEEIHRHTQLETLLDINFPLIQLAAWFHDAIYDPKSNNNEEKSADYAESALRELKIPITQIEQVKLLILSTKTHQASLADKNCQILLDADLSILGSSPSNYQSYAKAIRQEYSWVTDEVYQIKRQQILQSFLQRQRIYFTNVLFLTLEQRARNNLKLELLALSS